MPRFRCGHGRVPRGSAAPGARRRRGNKPQTLIFNFFFKFYFLIASPEAKGKVTGEAELGSRCGRGKGRGGGPERGGRWQSGAGMKGWSRGTATAAVPAVSCPGPAAGRAGGGSGTQAPSCRRGGRGGGGACFYGSLLTSTKGKISGRRRNSRGRAGSWDGCSSTGHPPRLKPSSSPSPPPCPFPPPRPSSQPPPVGTHRPAAAALPPRCSGATAALPARAPLAAAGARVAPPAPVPGASPSSVPVSPPAPCPLPRGPRFLDEHFPAAPKPLPKGISLSHLYLGTREPPAGRGGRRQPQGLPSLPPRSGTFLPGAS